MYTRFNLEEGDGGGKGSREEGRKEKGQNAQNHRNVMKNNTKQMPMGALGINLNAP